MTVSKQAASKVDTIEQSPYLWYVRQVGVELKASSGGKGMVRLFDAFRGSRKYVHQGFASRTGDANGAIALLFGQFCHRAEMLYSRVNVVVGVSEPRGEEDSQKS